MIHTLPTRATIQLAGAKRDVDVLIRYAHADIEPGSPDIHVISVQIATRSGWSDATWLETLISDHPDLRRAMHDHAMARPVAA